MALKIKKKLTQYFCKKILLTRNSLLVVYAVACCSPFHVALYRLIITLMHYNYQSYQSLSPYQSALLEDEGMEIKRQITGMMRALNDKAGRVYQRVGREGENLKQEPQDELLSWATPDPEEPQHSAWTCSPQPNNHLSPGQYGTRSKTQKILNQTKDLSNTNGRIVACVAKRTPTLSMEM